MPEIVTKYKLFIASPSDLNDDRQSIDEVIRELNLSFGQQNNIVIEGLKWETHSAPGASNGHVQEIISQDIGNDYDLFIGLMWLKFGTPTNVAGSGTEEEFSNALSRFQNNPKSIQILFYFKNALPKSLLDINPFELEKINNFKNNLGDENVLYWNYNTIEELQGFLRLHIPRRINNLKEVAPKSLKKEEVMEVNAVVITNDLGLLDYIEISENCLNESTTAICNITTATQWIGDRLTEKTDEINNLNKYRNHANNSLFRKSLMQTAQLMNEYASRIGVETPIFFENYAGAIQALSAIINISDDFYDKDNIDELIDSKKSIILMNAGISEALDGMLGYYDSVNSLPRIEKEINRAKRNVLAKLDELINNMKVSSQLAIELIRAISEKIDRINISLSITKI